MANYIDNDKITKSLCDWQDLNRERVAQGLAEVDLPRDVQRAIIDLAEGMTTRHNFRNYSWHDDMISDGVLAGWRAASKFDRFREKGTAVGFLNFCIWRAFGAVIKKQNENLEEMKKLMLDETYASFDEGDGDQIVSKNALISEHSINDMD